MEMLATGKLAMPEEKTPASGVKKVAIIGAGPAGLAAADDLAGRGFAVTVYEASSAAGGMLRWGIPEYRLPKNILDHEVELIRRKGVKFVYKIRAGVDVPFEKIQKENDAVFISVGSQASRKLGVEGEDKKGVTYGVEFLRAAAGANKPALKGKVIVIGGGNVAVDCARTALRLGAKNVSMVCLEQCDEMPALPEEIAATLEEGITMENGWGPQRVLGNGAVSGIEFKQCTCVYDENHRFSPLYDEKNLKNLTADTDYRSHRPGDGKRLEFRRQSCHRARLC